MAESSDRPAADDYEIVVEELVRPPRLFERILALVGRARTIEPHGVIVTVVHKDDGKEVFRHIEDAGPDDDHLLNVITSDLGTMTSAEFASRWGS